MRLGPSSGPHLPCTRQRTRALIKRGGERERTSEQERARQRERERERDARIHARIHARIDRHARAPYTQILTLSSGTCAACAYRRSAGPAGAVPAAAAAPVPAATAAAPAPAAAASAPAAAAAPPPLPAGWYAAIDEPTGKEYYYNAEGAVTWERPK